MYVQIADLLKFNISWKLLSKIKPDSNCRMPDWCIEKASCKPKISLSECRPVLIYIYIYIYIYSTLASLLPHPYCIWHIWRLAVAALHGMRGRLAVAALYGICRHGIIVIMQKEQNKEGYREKEWQRIEERKPRHTVGNRHLNKVSLPQCLLAMQYMLLHYIWIFFIKLPLFPRQISTART